jgi:hydrogenase maturation protease
MSYGSSAEQTFNYKESEHPQILVVGLGNPILGDDGIGWRVAEAVKTALLEEDPVNPNIEVACYSLGGLSLMERLIGYDQAIIIDAVQTATGDPGQIYDLSLADLPDLSAGHLTAVHDTSLQTALKLGQEMGAALPSEIRVVGIEADKVYDFSETLSPAIEASIPEALQLVLKQLDAMLQSA